MKRFPLFYCFCRNWYINNQLVGILAGAVIYNLYRCGYGGIGRRAGFRYQWASRAGSSPVIRIQNEVPFKDGTFSVLQG